MSDTTDKGAPAPALSHERLALATADLLREAADALDAAAREARRLRLDRDGLVGQRTLLHADCVALREDRAAAALEIGALRARVEEVEGPYGAIRGLVTLWACCEISTQEAMESIAGALLFTPPLPETGEVGNG